MNRLTVANFLRNNCQRFPLSSPFYVFVRPNHELKNEYSKVIKHGMQVQSVIYNDGTPHPNGWISFGWKDLLKLIRDNYRRRDEDQCNHHYDSGAVCTALCNHSHCRSCDEVTHPDWTMCILCWVT